MRQIFLDTETTGLSPDNGDRIVELACVELMHRKPTGNNLHFYLNPGRESHEEALKVHGLTSEFLRDKPGFEGVVDELLAYLSGAQVFIHNAPFDVGFLNRELGLAGRVAFGECVASVTDTLVMAKEMFPGKRNSLDALCSRLGVDNSGRSLHGALLDAELLAEVYLNMTRGQETLLPELAAVHNPGLRLQQVDLRTFELPVLHANEFEIAAHNELLKELDSASKGKTVWRRAPELGA